MSFHLQIYCVQRLCIFSTSDFFRSALNLTDTIRKLHVFWLLSFHVCHGNKCKALRYTSFVTPSARDCSLCLLQVAQCFLDLCNLANKITESKAFLNSSQKLCHVVSTSCSCFFCSCSATAAPPTSNTVNLYTHRSFYTKKSYTERLHCTEQLSHAEAFTQRNLYTEQLLHSDDLTQSGFYTRHFTTQKTLHRAALAQTNFCRQKLLRSQTLAHRRLYAQRRFYTHKRRCLYAQMPFYTEKLYTQTLGLHREGFTKRISYAQMLLRTETLCGEAFAQRNLYTEPHWRTKKTQRNCYTEQLLHASKSHFYHSC